MQQSPQTSAIFDVRSPTGTLVFVVGPSGAGKDTLIAYAQQTLAADTCFAFARRVVTRPAAADAEDHDSLTLEAFEAAERDGAFALTWRAHGLAYGLPRSIGDALAAGKVVIANTSRRAVEPSRQLAGRLIVAHVTASPDVLAQRLAQRGRETAESIANRLARAAAEPVPRDAVEIRNEGAMEIAGDAFVRILRQAAGLNRSRNSQ